MLHREGLEDPHYTRQEEAAGHPLWERFDSGLGGKPALFVNRITGLVTDRQPSQSTVRGGILAEEMGLGKTIELLSLILSHPRPAPPRPTEPAATTSKSRGKGRGQGKEKVDAAPASAPNMSPLGDYAFESGATLIISPSAIACQWLDEMEQHAPGLNIYHYQGITQNKLSAEEISRFDVVITTYECLRTEIHHARDPSDRAMRHSKKYVAQRSPLVEISWWRVCLDEAQMVESTAAHAAEMALRLGTTNRWAVTGTPIGRGGLEDLYGLFLFLQADPPADKFWWKHLARCYHDTSSASPSERQQMTSRLIPVLKTLLWRTSKSQVQHEICLPGQHTQTIPLAFSQVEQYNYKQLHDRCRDLIETARVAPAIIAQMVLQLRQTCCHPQIGAQNQRVFGGEYKNMDEVLRTMRRQALGDIIKGERALCIVRVKLATLLAEHLEKPQDARTILNEVLDFVTKKLEEAVVQEKERREQKAAAAPVALTLAPAPAPTESDPKGKGKAKVVETAEKETPAAALSSSSSTSSAGEASTSATTTTGTKKTARRSKGKEGETSQDDEDDIDNKKRPWQETLFRVFHRLSLTTEIKADKQTCETPLPPFDCLLFLRDFTNHIFFLCCLILVCLFLFQDEKRMLALKEDMLEGAKAACIAEKGKLAHHQKGAALYEACPTKFGIDPETPIPVLLELADFSELLNRDLKEILEVRGFLLDLIRSDLDEKPRRAGLYGHYSVLLTERQEKLTGIRLGLASEIKGVRDWWEEDMAVENLRYFATSLGHLAERPRTPKELKQALAHLFAQINECHRSQMMLVKDLEAEMHKFRPALEKRQICQRQAARLDKLLDVDLIGDKKDKDRRRRSKDKKRRQSDGDDMLVDSEDDGDDMNDDDDDGDKEPKEVQKRLNEEIQTLVGDIKKASGKKNYLEAIAAAEGEDQDTSCNICCDDIERGLLTPCGHLYCENCLTSWVSKHHKCPFCMAGIPTLADLTKITLKRPQKAGGDASSSAASSSSSSSSSAAAAGEESTATLDCPAYDLATEIAGGYGAKIEALTRYLVHLKKTDPTAKSLVFSQWEQVLRIVTLSLERNGLKYVRLEGAGKKNAVVQFRNDPETRVFLLNANSQSAGLTLVSATHVFLVEPVLNPAVELQAINRVHRIGQKRETQVHRLIIKDTIEERLHELAAENRRKIAQADAVSVVVTKPTIINRSEAGQPEVIENDVLKRIFELK